MNTRVDCRFLLHGISWTQGSKLHLLHGWKVSLPLSHQGTSYEGYAAASAAKSLQSCLTVCVPIDDSPPGSAVPGILQARIVQWVAISFSKAWKWKEKVKSLSRVQLLETPWTAAYQAPPSMGFSSQEYWSGLPLPSPCESYKLYKMLRKMFWGVWGHSPFGKGTGHWELWSL